MAGAAPVARPQKPSRRGSRAAGAGWPTVKLVLLAVVLIGLGAIIGFSVSRELARPATSSGAAGAGGPTRPRPAAGNFPRREPQGGPPDPAAIHGELARRVCVRGQSVRAIDG